MFRIHGAVLLAVVMLAAGCTGGGTAGTTPAAETPMKLLPEELVLFSSGSGEFQISGGRRPFAVTVDNSAALTILGGLDESRVQVRAGDVGTETSVRVTVRDAINSTSTATAKVRPNLITGAVTIEALPSSGDQTVSRCQDGTTLCAGALARATVQVTNPAGSNAGRAIRFDVIQGQFGFTTDATFTQTASTVTVLTDANGTASAVLKASPDAATQPAMLRVTDEATGARQSVTFTIGGRSLAVVPAKVTLTGPRRGVCGFGAADFQVFGGLAPYSVTVLSANAVVDTPIVPRAGAKFRVSVGQPATCVNFTIPITITDAQGSVVTASIDVFEGTATVPSIGVSPASVTVNSCTSHASAAVTGNPTAVAAPPEVTTSLSGNILTVRPAQRATNGNYNVVLTDGSTSASLAVVFANLPAGGCP